MAAVKIGHKLIVALQSLVLSVEMIVKINQKGQICVVSDSGFPNKSMTWFAEIEGSWFFP